MHVSVERQPSPRGCQATRQYDCITWKTAERQDPEFKDVAMVDTIFAASHVHPRSSVIDLWAHTICCSHFLRIRKGSGTGSICGANCWAHWLFGRLARHQGLRQQENIMSRAS